MALINLKDKHILIKLVYYGPGRSGKTTNLVYIYNKLKQRFSSFSSKLITINTRGDRTLYFDFFPVELGKIQGLDIKLQLYTTPGQVLYESTRRLVLKGVDGIIFVADSLVARREANIENLENLKQNLEYHRLDLKEIPLVFQWNKRDLANNGIALLDIDTLESDLNSDLKAPSFPASAFTGFNVFETLRTAAKLTIRYVIRKLLVPQFKKNATLLNSKDSTV